MYTLAQIMLENKVYKNFCLTAVIKTGDKTFNKSIKTLSSLFLIKLLILVIMELRSGQ